jgi:5-oxoprolinase (ATP-hydrolysing) subunit C
VRFTVERVIGLVTFQDLGHHGRMHLAVPPGGALVPELLVASNRRVDNADDATCLEVQGRVVIRATETNETFDVSSGPSRCAYLAVRGGFLAGHRPLAVGDVIASTTAPPTTVRVAQPRFADGESVTIIPGPDLDAFGADALTILVSAPYRISPASNRVGTRLEGPALPRRADYRERSRPMVQGALEVPRDGQPIALGPEHPTTGGYPVIGVIASAELGRFHAIRLGGSVQFRIAASRVTSSR